MKYLLSMGIALLVSISALQARASPWVEGRNYVLLNPLQQTHVSAGKVEVLEVFSYACPACNGFQPVMEKLKRSLPANAQLTFLPVAFNPAEDMPMFQRAFSAAQSLGVADRAHQAIFDAIWKTGELAIENPSTHRLKSPPPTLEDAAKCYSRITGVKPEEFLQAARSFGVDSKMRAADAQMKAMRVPGTPCLIVNGKYRIELSSLGSTNDVIDIVRFLVAKESSR
jgi:protein dithiol oxidoreductase (disulfide-forming)